MEYDLYVTAFRSEIQNEHSSNHKKLIHIYCCQPHSFVSKFVVEWKKSRTEKNISIALVSIAIENLDFLRVFATQSIIGTHTQTCKQIHLNCAYVLSVCVCVCVYIVCVCIIELTNKSAKPKYRTSRNLDTLKMTVKWYCLEKSKRRNQRSVNCIILFICFGKRHQICIVQTETSVETWVA